MIIFTICSANYLANAKSLADSVHRFSAYKFIIVLVDKFIDNEYFNKIKSFYNIIEIEQVLPDSIEELWKKFNIIELNTAVKPFVFKYLFEKFKEENKLVYFDPDIILYDNVEIIEQELEDSSMLLTPHILTPIELDNHFPDETLFLRYGLYNLGFFAVKRSVDTSYMLDWWGERTFNLGHSNIRSGLFVDQLWMNYLPVFFNDVKILKSKAMNMGFWNLHERVMDTDMNVNNEKLLFYHFSGFNSGEKGSISKHQNRFKLTDRKDLIFLFEDYLNTLIKNDYEYFRKLPCYYMLIREKYIRNLRKDKILELPSKVIKFLFTPKFIRVTKYYYNLIKNEVKSKIPG